MAGVYQTDPSVRIADVSVSFGKQQYVRLRLLSVVNSLVYGRMSESLVLSTQSEAETLELGLRLADVLTPGTVVALNGPLGAGKTNFVRAVCIGLGANESQVNSPTFVLMQSYVDGRLPVFHFDTYRLADSDEFLAIGGDEYLQDAEAVCFVEWAERIVEVFPKDHLCIEICPTGRTSRRFTMSDNGPESSKIVTALKAGSD